MLSVRRQRSFHLRRRRVLHTCDVAVGAGTEECIRAVAKLHCSIAGADLLEGCAEVGDGGSSLKVSRCMAFYRYLPPSLLWGKVGVQLGLIGGCFSARERAFGCRLDVTIGARTEEGIYAETKAPRNPGSTCVPQGCAEFVNGDQSVEILRR